MQGTLANSIVFRPSRFKSSKIRWPNMRRSAEYRGGDTMDFGGMGSGVRWRRAGGPVSGPARADAAGHPLVLLAVRTDVPRCSTRLSGSVGVRGTANEVTTHGDGMSPKQAAVVMKKLELAV